MNTLIFGIIAAVFLAATLGLGLYGYRNTKDSDEFLLGRNKTNPIIIALSYGATFLSASAIVGFGGQAANYGMSMIWLVFLNLFLGLFVAFVVFGRRTHRIGSKLGAYTFADFLGKRFDSKFIRTFTAVIILVGMPIYCAAVLLGGVNFIGATLDINLDVVLLVLAVIVVVYVVYGGIIAVMYNDALQAGIMFVGMAVILVATYAFLGDTFGNPFEVNSALGDLWGQILGNGASDPNYSAVTANQANGMNGWTSFSTFGSNIWLTVVTTFLLGVGIGALSQPQLAVRFMSAKNERSLNRSLIVGSIFMIIIVGTAYTVGALSNLYFFNESGLISVVKVGNIDMIMPTFVSSLFGHYGIWGDIFISVFMLAIVCASISTMSALLHTMGSAGGYDILSQVKERNGKKLDLFSSESLKWNRLVTNLMMVVVVIVAYVMPDNIIAKATSIFMGLTAATLLPAYTYAIFCKGEPNVNGAKASIVAGAIVWVFWAFFVNKSIAGMLGLCKAVTGDATIVTGWLMYVDPLVIALPIACIALLAGCLVRPKAEAPAAC